MQDFTLTAVNEIRRMLLGLISRLATTELSASGFS
jgi:hypothetical protein